MLESDFLALAPVFKGIIDFVVCPAITDANLILQGLGVCLKGKEASKPHKALRSAITSIAYWRLGAKIESQLQVVLARYELNSILDSGVVSKIAVDVLPSEQRL